MAKFTLLEVHLDGSEFTANAPYSGVTDGEDDGVGDDEDRAPDVDVSFDEPSGGGTLLRLVLGAVVVLAIVALVRKFVGGTDTETDDEIDAE